jgi:hypothetical protein
MTRGRYLIVTKETLMKSLRILIASMLLVNVGLPASAQSAFCKFGSQKLMTDSEEATLNAVAAACKPGDIIAMPPAGSGGEVAAARLCDFSKAMPIAGGVLVCVMVLKRELR